MPSLRRTKPVSKTTKLNPGKSVKSKSVKAVNDIVDTIFKDVNTKFYFDHIASDSFKNDLKHKIETSELFVFQNGEEYESTSTPATIINNISKKELIDFNKQLIEGIKNKKTNIRGIPSMIWENIAKKLQGFTVFNNWVKVLLIANPIGLSYLTFMYFGKNMNLTLDKYRDKLLKDKDEKTTEELKKFVSDIDDYLVSLKNDHKNIFTPEIDDLSKINKYEDYKNKFTTITENNSLYKKYNIVRFDFLPLAIEDLEQLKTKYEKKINSLSQQSNDNKEEQAKLLGEYINVIKKLIDIKKNDKQIKDLDNEIKKLQSSLNTMDTNGEKYLFDYKLLWWKSKEYKNTMTNLSSKQIERNAFDRKDTSVVLSNKADLYYNQIMFMLLYKGVLLELIGDSEDTFFLNEYKTYIEIFSNIKDKNNHNPEFIEELDKLVQSQRIMEYWTVSMNDLKELANANKIKRVYLTTKFRLKSSKTEKIANDMDLYMNVVDAKGVQHRFLLQKIYNDETYFYNKEDDNIAFKKYAADKMKQPNSVIKKNVK